MNKKIPITVDNLLMNQKPVLALIQINTNGPTIKSKVAQNINSTFAHTSNIFQRLEEMDLIEQDYTELSNRAKFYTTTRKGEMAALKLLEIVVLIKK